jgi:hypothetical protein
MLAKQTPARKRRASKVVVEEVEPDGAEAPPPKKRGRPRKTVLDVPQDLGDEAIKVLRRLMLRAGVILGNGRHSREYCGLCETSGVHGRFKRCSCPCHDAQTLLDKVEAAQGARKAS